MCLKTKFSKEQREKWIKDHEDGGTITAYKLATVLGKGPNEKFISPYFYTTIRKKNRLRPTSIPHDSEWTKELMNSEAFQRNQKTNFCFSSTKRKQTAYIAYYHLYASQRSAGIFAYGARKVLKCKVPTKFITEIGYEGSHLVIVTRGFDVEGKVR